MNGTKRLNRSLLAALGVALAIVCFLALNTFGALELRDERLDLTENRQYTLSPATLELLSEIDEPITLRLYVSGAIRETNPFLWSYAQQVHDLLGTYAEASRGRITLEFIDPEPFSTEEDRAVGFGLEALPLDAAGNAGYIGLAGTNSTDDTDVIPVLAPDREPFLEYDLTRLVFNLAHPEKPVVALVTSLPLNGDPALQYRPWQIFQQLGQFFDIRFMGGDVSRFDDDVDLLLLVHPTNLSGATQFAIDQFALRGGKIMAFVDPHSEAGAARQRQQQQPGLSASSLDGLLGAWGLELVPGKVVGDPTYARQVQFPSGGRQQIVDYLPWLSVGPPGLAGDQVITAELARVNLASAGIVRATEGATTTLLPLITSSPAAQAIDATAVAVYPDPLALIRGYEPGGEPLVMAARVTGAIRSAFPDQLPEGVTAGEDRLLEATAPLNLVVVADTDLLEDRSWFAAQGMFGGNVGVPVADNANFVANALDYLAGSEALAALRGRDVTQRPFTRIEEIRRAAELQYRAKEQELLTRLQETQNKLAQLQVSAGEERSTFSAAQQEELDRFRADLLGTRQELREVRHALRSDIEDLRAWLLRANIALVPAIVAVVAILLAVLHRRRTRRRFDLADA